MAPRIALVDRSSPGIPPWRLAEVASALQTQVDRDVGPIWGVAASVVTLPAAALGPLPVWPIWLVSYPPGADGGHRNAQGIAYGLVWAHADNWTVAASHEMVEMLIDPLGGRFLGGPSLDPTARARPVRYLLEVADPVQTFSYSIRSVEVSDFVTPAFYGHPSRDPRIDLLCPLGGPFRLTGAGSIRWW